MVKNVFENENDNSSQYVWRQTVKSIDNQHSPTVIFVCGSQKFKHLCGASW